MQLYIHQLEEAETRLDAGMQRGLATAVAETEPWTRLAALVQLSAGAVVRDRLARAIASDRALVDARKLTTDRMSLMVMDAEETLRQKTKPRFPANAGLDYSQHAADVIDDEMPPTLELRGRLIENPIILTVALVWPAWWILGAFVLRGGLTYRLSGIALVRANGKPALRLQCAWRALVVWLPFVLCLLATMELDDRYWTHWRPPMPLAENAWMLWLSWGLWWLALFLLPIYLGLALRYPARGVQDRLAGTYLVPR
jgi:hypothetical protein